MKANASSNAIDANSLDIPTIEQLGRFAERRNPIRSYFPSPAQRNSDHDNVNDPSFFHTTRGTPNIRHIREREFEKFLINPWSIWKLDQNDFPPLVVKSVGRINILEVTYAYSCKIGSCRAYDTHMRGINFTCTILQALLFT
jgi:hypothetical protein